MFPTIVVNMTTESFKTIMSLQTITPLVSLPLDILVKDLLGEAHYVSISRLTAEILYGHCKNRHTCHIQFPGEEDVDVMGRVINEPILWSMSAWQSAVERRLKAKLRSDRERDERFIFEANIKLVGKALARFSGLEFEIARLTARRWLVDKDHAKIRAIGVVKLYTTIQELP